jgi:hypothetical protein
MEDRAISSEELSLLFRSGTKVMEQVSQALWMVSEARVVKARH